MNKEFYDYLKENGWSILNWPPTFNQCDPTFIRVLKNGIIGHIKNDSTIQQFEEKVKEWEKINEETRENPTKFDRDDFMEFFRDDDCLNTLSVEDRIEVFMSILLGSSDITAQLLEDLLTNYSVDNLEIIEK